MTALVRSFAAVVVLASAAAASAQPVAQPPAQPAVQPAQPASDTGFIGKGVAHLEIDDCPVGDPAASEAQLTSRFDGLYERGEVLYAQGDYPGAVRELISGYCVAGQLEAGRKVRYNLLKDIGQAYERSLDFEKAIAYFERFARELPPAAVADRQLYESRILVLQKLRAQIFVESEPGGATVTIVNESGVAGRGRSGKPIDVLGGTYTMQVELDGYVPYSKDIEVRIGKPFAYFVALRPQQGRLSVQVSPGDAKVFLRDKSVERFVGIGRVDEVLPAGNYVLIAEAADRPKQERPIEVLPNRVNLMQFDLPPRPQFGRRQLVAFAAAAAMNGGGGILYTFGNGPVASLGAVGGLALGLFGSYLYLPDQVPLGTANLTITSGIAGTAAGIAGGLLFTTEERAVWPIQGAATLVGTALGYYVGDRTKISVGDAALFNTSVVWGTTVGGLFALSFGGDRRISTGLVLSGLGMGATSGVLMCSYFDISRRHAALIDLGGIVGLVGGLAVEGVAYPSSAAGEASQSSNEHVGNFMLGGVAIGLIGAGFLTRNLDSVKLPPVKPAIGAATAANGAQTAVYGISGSW